MGHAQSSSGTSTPTYPNRKTLDPSLNPNPASDSTAVLSPAEQQVQVLPTSLKKVMLEEGVTFEAAEKILTRLQRQKQVIPEFSPQDSVTRKTISTHDSLALSSSSLLPDPSLSVSRSSLSSPSPSPTSAKSHDSNLSQAKSVASIDEYSSVETGSLNSSPIRYCDLSPNNNPSYSRHGSLAVSLDYESIKPGEWKKGRKIGQGSFGEVYHGRNKCQLIVIKAVPLVDRGMDIVAIQNEINVMKCLRHPHIVQYLGAEIQVEEHKLLIFQEWVPGGSIRKNLDEFGPFEDSVIREYTRQVLSGLIYLHEHHIIHRDIKGANILVNERGIVKLADFGACKLLAEDVNGNPASSSLRGTPYFMAPEVLLRQPYGRRADIWSLGGAVLEMATGHPPWRQVQDKVYALAEHISKTLGPPPLPETLHPQLRAFLLRCFERDRLLRPTAAVLAEDPYLHAYEVESKSPKRCASTPDLIAMHRYEDFNGGYLTKGHTRIRRINTQYRFSWVNDQEIPCENPSSTTPASLPSPSAHTSKHGTTLGLGRPSSATTISSNDSSPETETPASAVTHTQSSSQPFPNSLPRRQMRHLSIRTEKTDEEVNSPVFGPLFQPPRTPESDAIQEFYEQNHRMRKRNILQCHRNCDSAPAVNTSSCPSPSLTPISICSPTSTSTSRPRAVTDTNTFTPSPGTPLQTAGASSPVEVSNWPEWAKRKHRDIVMTLEANIQTETQTHPSDKVDSTFPQLHLSPSTNEYVASVTRPEITGSMLPRSHPSLVSHIAWQRSQRRGPLPKFIRQYETLEEVANESESPMGSPKAKPRSKRHSLFDNIPSPLTELNRSESDSPGIISKPSAKLSRAGAISTHTPLANPTPCLVTESETYRNPPSTDPCLRSPTFESLNVPESPRGRGVGPSLGIDVQLSPGSHGYSRSSSVSSAASTPSATQVEFQSEFGTFRNSTTFRAVSPAVLLTAQASRRRTRSSVSDASAEIDLSPEEPIRMTADEGKNAKYEIAQKTTIIAELLAELEAVTSLRKNEHMRLTRRRSIRWFVNLWNRKQELKKLDRELDRASDTNPNSNPNPTPSPDSSSERKKASGPIKPHVTAPSNPFARSRIVQNSTIQLQL